MAARARGAKVGNAARARRRAAPHHGHARPRMAAALARYAVAPATYEEAILGAMVRGSPRRSVPDEAFLMGTALSSLSQGMKDLQYQSGLRIGRSLYGINNGAKHYILPEESIADLVSFFESVGYRYVTYVALPDRLEIAVLDRKGPNIGTNLHSFEAGIISGFMSAAKHRYLHVSEVSCVNNKGQSCRFMPSAAEPAAQAGVDEVGMLDGLIGHIAENVAHPAHAGAGMSTEYYALLLRMLFDRSYVDSVKSIVSYLGMGIGERVFESREMRHDGRSTLGKIAETISLLGLGAPEIKGVKPMHIQVSYGGLESRREFVDLSLAFINGLLSSRFSSDMVAVERSRGGRYTIDIRERKA